jgi:integrase
VWTLPQLITFLAGVKDDRLAALWWLVALRGLRRGEIADLHADDLDTQAHELTIHSQQVALPGQLYCGPPKSRASNRTIALDTTCVQRLLQQAILQNTELLEHRFVDQRRSDARIRTGPGWQRTGQALFTYADGRATDRRRAGGGSGPRVGSIRVGGCARPVVLVQGSPQLRVEQAPDEVVSGGGQPVLHVLVAGGVPAAGGR